jgi:THAP4-like, heme-binding beta-barrel domain
VRESFFGASSVPAPEVSEDGPAGLAADFETAFVPAETHSRLDRALQPLAFIIGTWRGVGVGGYPGTESFRFGQELVFTHAGAPVISYVSRSWLLDDAGAVVEAAAGESGYWRMSDAGELEMVLAHSSGVAEIWVGDVTGTKIELATDVVARTASAWQVTAGHRLYGLVEGDLLYAYDLAVVDQPLTSYLSARLRRIV